MGNGTSAVGKRVCNNSVGSRNDFTFKHGLAHTLNRRDLTYIFGSKCIDGVVLVGDRKISGGTDVLYEDKIFMDIPPIVVGSSGVYALFEKFRTKVNRYIEMHKSGPVDEFITAIEKYTRELNEAYRDVLETRWSFDALLAMVTSKGAFLQYILPQGLAEPVRRYKAIGHGEPYGSLFLKKLWNERMTMNEAAELGYLVVRYIERNELDNSVGVGLEKPQVWFIPNTGQPKEQSGDLLDGFEERSLKRLEKMASDVSDLWKTA
jgi:20S proteasome alpha/beta subunit